VERVLERKLSTLASEDFTSAGGIDSIVEVLNNVDRGTEKIIIEALEEEDPELAEEIKKRMFVFEDIVLLDRQTATRVLAEVAEDDLLLSLKATEQKVEDFVWECVVPARVQALKERLTKMGRARLSDVDAAQQRIVGVIRRMDEEGLIVVARPGETVD
jgi:flagellar motor switch protein FliG